jgi:hypothetical protein
MATGAGHRGHDYPRSSRRVAVSRIRVMLRWSGSGSVALRQPAAC